MSAKKGLANQKSIEGQSQTDMAIVHLSTNPRKGRCPHQMPR